MATIRIMQIPTETGSYTGTNTFDECLPSNYWPIAPVTVRIDEDLSSYFKVKYILRIYKNSVSASNLLSTLKQRTNNNSSTTNQIAIFDIKGIVNTQLKFTKRDANSTTFEIHKLGRNVTDKIFSANDSTIKTIIVVATWERSTSASNPPEEQTGDTVQMTMYFAPSSFRLFQVVNEDINPLNKYFVDGVTNSNFLTNNPFQHDKRTNAKLALSYPAIGRINYVSASKCYHTLGFLNKSGWGSDGQYMSLQYYDKTGSQIGDTYTIKNDTSQGGTPPASATSDDAYMLFVGVGTANLNAYVGESYKNSVLQDPFDGQPDNITGWARYDIRMCNNVSGSGAKTLSQVFIKDDSITTQTNVDNDTVTVNCLGQQIIRLGWINNLGAYDYYNFRGGFVETLNSERMEYSSIIGAEELNDGNVYTFDTWSRGKHVLKTNTTLKARVESQFMSEKQGELLEPLFSSPDVMIIDNGIVTPTFEGTSQPVIVTNKSFERKTTGKNGVQIKYTFDIELASKLNTIE